VALLYFQFTSTLAREQLQYFGFQQRSSLVLAGIVEHLSALVVIQPWKSYDCRSQPWHAKPQQPVPVGSTFAGPYRIIRYLAHGETSCVCEGQDLLSDQTVA
jgi:hypothetical protein